MRVSLAAALILLNGAFGCGKSDSGGGGHDVQPLTVTSHEPVHYGLADQECQTAPTTVELTKATIQAWDEQKVVTRDVALHDMRSADSLTSQAIKNTTYKDVYERTCDWRKARNHWCDDANGQDKSWYMTAKAQPLRLCQDGGAYGRLTVEGVALTSAYYLQRAHDRYRALAATAADPKAIELSVFPEFVDYYENFTTKDGQTERLKTWITHNLAYFPEGQMIAVFPERADQSASMPGYFWESEFVLSHEYGHHIDFTRHGHVLASSGLRWDSLTHSYTDDIALAQGLAGATDRAQIAGALAEGFADMMAFYSEGGTSRSLVGVPDIGFNRNIANASFANGEEKILTDERLAYLFGNVEEVRPPAGYPSYKDIHVIGAIIAHTADAVFATLTATHPELGHDADMDQRYKLTLVYMDALVAETAGLGLDKTGDQVLVPIGHALQKAAEQYLASFPLAGGDDAAVKVKGDVCKMVRRNLPALGQAPFASGTGC